MPPRDVAGPVRGPAVTVADVALLTLPILTFVALVAGSMALPRPVQASLRRDRTVLVIDSVLITGSLLAIIWSAHGNRSLGDDGRDPWVFAVALAYPIVDLVLVVMGVLLLIYVALSVQSFIAARKARLGR
jgi:hypothetical protein